MDNLRRLDQIENIPRTRRYLRDNLLQKMQKKERKLETKHTPKKQNAIQLTVFESLRWHVCTEKTQNSRKVKIDI